MEERWRREFHNFEEKKRVKEAELTQKDKRQEELQREIPFKTVQPQLDTPYKLEQEDWTQLIVTKLTQWFQSVGILRQASIEH